MVLHEAKARRLVCQHPRAGRTADDRKVEERECLLVIVNAEPIGTGPEIGIHRAPVGILHQQVKGEDGDCLIALHTHR